MLSIIIPARDAAATLPRALASVAGLGAEVIVEHDSDGDGPAATRNRALQRATGTHVGFLDADDEWLAPTSDPRIGTGRVVLGAVEVVDPGGATRHGHIWGTPGLLVERSVFDEIGPFDTTRRTGEDLDWILRARDAGIAIAQVEAVVYRYRRRPGSLTFEAADGHAALVDALRASIVRRKEPA